MGEAKKIVLKLAVNDDKEKKKAMKAVSSILGIESINIDMNEKKLTVVGDIDPVEVVEKLRKLGHTEILTVGPAKEPEKKEGDEKKDEKKDGEKKKDPIEILAEQFKAWNDQFYAPNPYYGWQYNYCVQSMEENPNLCHLLIIGTHGNYNITLFTHECTCKDASCASGLSWDRVG